MFKDFVNFWNYLLQGFPRMDTLFALYIQIFTHFCVDCFRKYLLPTVLCVMRWNSILLTLEIIIKFHDIFQSFKTVPNGGTGCYLLIFGFWNFFLYTLEILISCTSSEFFLFSWEKTNFCLCIDNILIHSVYFAKMLFYSESYRIFHI